MRPADILFVGVALLAVLLFIGGVIDVFGVPVKLRRRRRCKPVRHRRADRRARADLREDPKLDDELVSQSRGLVDFKAGPADSGTVDVDGLREATAPRSARWLMFLTTALCVGMSLGLFMLRSREERSVHPHPPSLGPSPVQQAEMLAGRGDYEQARGLFYQALQAAPEDVSLWYGLGVTLSHLNRRKETVEAFQYVVDHGRAGSEQVRLARRWLVSAGVPVESVAFAAVAADPVIDTRGDTAAVKGQVTWGAPDPGRPVRIQLLLAGLNGDAKGKRFNTRAVLGGSYRFEGLPAGSYRLIGAAAGQHLWDLTLAVEDGREVVLDLGKDNSSTPTIALYQ